MRFNIFTKRTNKTANHEGAEAYSLTPQMELYTAVASSSLSDTFYEKTSQRIERLRSLIAKNDPWFVAKLAVYAREKMHLRSVPLVLAVELAKIHNGDGLVSQMTDRIIGRADEITELLAYYQISNGRGGVKKLNSLSKQLQRGLAKAFNRFDEYAFAKYNRNAEVKLRDALFLVHPKAKSEAQQVIFDKIASDTLATPYTWETELSALGQREFASEKEKAIAFRQKWEELIDSGKLGYMALLRNLRNILEAHVGEAHLAKVAARLADAEAVRNSKQFPFRFLSAYTELQSVNSYGTSLLMNALEDAMVASAANISGFDRNTKVLVACDFSGSMQSPLSARSKVQYVDVGIVLGMLLQSRCASVQTGMFGDSWKRVNLPSRGILANAESYRKRVGEVGHSTNGFLIIQDLLNRREVVDKVMFFTDCQFWDSTFGNVSMAALWRQYVREVAPNAKAYFFNLAGYGTTPLDNRQGNVFLISGWSDKVFDVLAALERGEDALSQVKAINL